jgi:hypothetical protein
MRKKRYRQENHNAHQVTGVRPNETVPATKSRMEGADAVQVTTPFRREWVAEMPKKDLSAEAHVKEHE